MKKNVVQDVVPPKKSIRNVTIPIRTALPKKDKPPSIHPIEDNEFTRPVAIRQEPPIRITETPPPTPPTPPINIPNYKYDFDQPKKTSKKWLYISIIFLILAGAFGISSFFKSAIVKVTPKQESLSLLDSFRAQKEATGTGLGFQVVTVSKSVEKVVAATGEEKVDKKAQGRVIIYNETTQAQKLVATTRFETPEGLIFRIVSAVTVPAKTLKDGKNVAGSIEALVEADKTGSSYNVGLKDFTIPGFKGDPKYKQVYARSKTEMTGGFSGMQKIVSKDVLDKSEAELETALKEALSKDITTQIPANFVLYVSSISYKLSPAEQTEGTNDSANLKKIGTASAIIFDKTSLTRIILAKLAPQVTTDTVIISNIESLEFSYNGVFDPNSDSSLNFSLKGSPNIVWIFDENKLKTELLGLSRTKAKVVLSTYDTIKEAWVETHPFWNQGIPKDPEKVTLINTLNQ